MPSWLLLQSQSKGYTTPSSYRELGSADTAAGGLPRHPWMGSVAMQWRPQRGAPQGAACEVHPG
eukprot:5473730-Amphidinium_carterae.1